MKLHKHGHTNANLYVFGAFEILSLLFGVLAYIFDVYALDQPSRISLDCAIGSYDNAILTVQCMNFLHFGSTLGRLGSLRPWT